MKTGEALWTIDQLTAEVESALAKGYDGAASGRVRDIPDRRTIRYYTTLGLIDRPAAMRGRTALYGKRHLVQIVAIKKLQAGGRSLAEVQQALTGQTFAEMARIAGLAVEEGGEPETPKAERAFWRQEPSAPEPPNLESEDAPPEVAPAGGPPGPGRPLTLSGIPLHPGVTLLLNLSRPIDDDDLEAIRSAAIPLILTLTRSRLIDSFEGGENS